jgi:hypothetical protein
LAVDVLREHEGTVRRSEAKRFLVHRFYRITARMLINIRELYARDVDDSGLFILDALRPNKVDELRPTLSAGDERFLEISGSLSEILSGQVILANVLPIAIGDDPDDTVAISASRLPDTTTWTAIIGAP